MQNNHTNSGEQIAELEALTAGFVPSLKRGLIMWAIRWAIGFGLIALAVKVWPSITWLWWVGAAVAGLSLLSMLVMQLVLQRKAASVHQRLDDLDQMVAELEEESSRD